MPAMGMTSVHFESSHSVGMSDEGHQMVCEVWLLFQSHKKSEVCVYYTGKGVIGCLDSQQRD